MAKVFTNIFNNTNTNLSYLKTTNNNPAGSNIDNNTNNNNMKISNINKASAIHQLTEYPVLKK